MSRLTPLPPSALSEELQDAMQKAEDLLGFMPNDALIMARDPELVAAFGNLVSSIYRPGSVDAGLKRLIGLMTSSAAGCQYCVGHTAFTGRAHGVSEAKLADVWEFETSDHYTEAERTALRVAMHAGQVPNGVTDEMFAELKRHFDEKAIVEIVSVIAMFGFLNRWNSTFATDIESAPAAAAGAIPD